MIFYNKKFKDYAIKMFLKYNHEFDIVDVFNGIATIKCLKCKEQFAVDEENLMVIKNTKEGYNKKRNKKTLVNTNMSCKEININNN